ncbi:steroid 3-ketoacyl-CoA thiolase [Actinomadura sp. LD22]|uniref:Steroid 3-ketoacyl-CoA thiolase n=1 Tax=Actinomadura physcomitrii TaxID=2650748 RepID=A0A6I4MLH7_9ACTN|nr:steroid 3-ketoacyl-CoA thiolase [Actinomadura physcomitrii]MWA04827.1 steroid 3-ketoacyl-CoA thiolase [Actinomadura physcomitrii]
MNKALILDAVRSPLGKAGPGGMFSDVSAADLLGQTVRALLSEAAVEPREVDALFVACPRQPDAIVRTAADNAGIAEHARIVTVPGGNAAGQEVVNQAAQAIASGAADLVVAAGVESTTSPRGSGPETEAATGRTGTRTRSTAAAAASIAEKWGLSGADLDAFAVRSRARAAACSPGDFLEEIAHIAIANPAAQPLVVRTDETLDGNAVNGHEAASADGAAAVLLVSERAVRLGMRPRAAIRAFCHTAGDPDEPMLSGAIAATEMVLRLSGLRVGQFDHYEVLEEFAAVPLAWQAEFGVDSRMLNPRGGALALGHPVGASGCRMMATMLNALEATGGRLGLQMTAEPGGATVMTVVER